MPLNIPNTATSGLSFTNWFISKPGQIVWSNGATCLLFGRNGSQNLPPSLSTKGRTTKSNKYLVPKPTNIILY